MSTKTIIEWSGVVLSLAGAYVVATDIRLGAIIWIVSNSLLLLWATRSKIWSMAMLQAVFLIINSRTLFLN